MEGLAGGIVLLWGWRRALAAFLAGALAVLALPPYNFFAACFVSFPVLVWLLDGAAPPPRAGLLSRLAPAFGIGWWFGFGYFLAGLWWIGKAFMVEAEQVGWLMPFAVLGLPAFLALFYGLAAMLARIVWSDGLGRIAALAAAFGLCEWLRATVLSGFPWNAVGYTAMPIPLLMQPAALVGVYGMNMLAVLVFAMPAMLAWPVRRAWPGLAIATLLVLADAGFGYVRLAAPSEAGAPKLSVRIVQLSLDQSEKWDPEIRDRIFRSYLDQSAKPAKEKRPTVIVWPETALPFIAAERPDALSAIGDMLQDGQMLLTGAVRSEGQGLDQRYYNSVIAIDASGVISDAVDKVHLVPGGEYVPFQGLLERIGIRHIAGSQIGFSAAAAHRTITLPGGVKALPLICYEVIFAGAGGAAAKSADLIVNVTNDAWFGDTPGPYQHLRQAQLRAVESGLPLVRGAGNGISALIDPYGRILDGLKLDAVGTLDGEIPLARARIAMPWSAGWNALLIFLLLGAAALVSSLKPHRV